jgi:hypothetical protein
MRARLGGKGVPLKGRPDKLTHEHSQPRRRCPDFSLPSTHGPQTLEGYRGEWLVLYFYPKDDGLDISTVLSN